MLPQGRKNDMAYFTVLLRYIHQNRRTKQGQRPNEGAARAVSNSLEYCRVASEFEELKLFGLCLARRRKTTVNPVKAGIVERVKDYEYSSWSEFDGTVEPVFQICDTRTVLNRIPFKDLEEPTNEARADECSLSICLARRRKTIVNGSTTHWMTMLIA